MKRRLFSSIVAVIGFILSPVSWWNDLVVNFPISYFFALPVGLINKKLFLPMFIINYWLTNILGLILMHIGINGAKNKETKKLEKKDVLKTFGFGLAYTVLVVILILTGVLEFPEEFLDKFIEMTK